MASSFSRPTSRPLPLKKKPGQSKVPMHIAASDQSGADTYAALDLLERLDPVVGEARAGAPLYVLTTS